MRSKHSVAFWGVQVPGWFLFLYLVYAQGIAAFGYEIGVSMGTQEPSEVVTEVGAAFWYGFALGDLLIYIPLLLAGLIGHLRETKWGYYLMAAALGVTVYWPVVCLSALVAARGAKGWNLESEISYWLVLPGITLWGLWALIMVGKRLTKT